MTHLSDGYNPAYATCAACYDVFNTTLPVTRWSSMCLSVFKLNGHRKIEKRRHYSFTFTPPNNEKYMALFIEWKEGVILPHNKNRQKIGL